MIKQILEFLEDIFKSPSLHETLEAHIAAGNPTSEADVERLQEEFFRQRQSLFFDRYI